jgi:outer membrane protein insertion porin family
MLAGISTGFLLAGQTDLYELAGIEVSGTNKTDDKAIIAVSGLSVGEKLEVPGPKISRAIKALWQQRLFRDVQIHIARKEAELVFLEITVIEATRLKDWKVKGMKKNARQEIETLLNTQLKRGSGWLPSDGIKIRQVVNDHLQQKGYAFAALDIIEKYSDDSSSLSLLFEINRGKKQKIKSLSFEGNQKLSSRQLRRQMSLKGSLLRKAPFVASTLKADKSSLVAFYRSEGYKDMEITGDSLWKDEKGKLHLKINIREGRAYYVGDIKGVGNSAYPTSTLQKILGIESGDVYDSNLLNQRLHYDESGRDISSLYMDNGYLFLQIEPIEKGIRGDKIDLEIRIMEGPLATISEVNIVGNDRTHEEVIRRELLTKPGQKFNRSAIIRSQRTLMAMGYFKPESMNVSTDVNSEQGTVAVTYELEESRNEQFELSAGYNPASGQVVGTLGISLENFSMRNLLKGENWSPLPSGDGQTLSLRLQSTGLEYQGGNFSFTEPWLGGKRPNMFTVSGFYQRFTNGEPVSSDAFNSLSVTGGSLQLGTRFRFLNRPFIFSAELSGQHINLNDYRDIALEDGSVISSGRFNNLYLKPKLAYRSTGDPFFPRQGIQAEFSVQFTPPYRALGLNEEQAPYRWLEYHKWRFNIDGYMPLGQKLVLKGSWKSGWLGSYHAALGTPPFERFEFGGNGISSTQAGFVGNDIISMRGYETSEFAGNSLGGGAAFAKAAVELRYELANTPSLRAFVLGFAEAGNLWQDAGELNPFDMRPALGAGIRLQLPMFGTLGFDYGLGLDKPELSGSHWSKYGTFNLILGFEPE